MPPPDAFLAIRCRDASPIAKPIKAPKNAHAEATARDAETAWRDRQGGHVCSSAPFQSDGFLAETCFEPWGSCHARRFWAAPSSDQRFAEKDAAQFLLNYPEDAALIVQALLAAEDHRAPLHSGIDVLSFIRAAISKAPHSRICGVSTIEQQYVRTIFKRSGTIWKSKLQELSIVISARGTLRKEAIWLGYLWRAYYGHELQGYVDARAYFCESGQNLDLKTACQIIACLKYPKPRSVLPRWAQRHSQRVKYIENLVRNGRRRWRFLLRPLRRLCLMHELQEKQS
jgi:hypothetical protein